MIKKLGLNIDHVATLREARKASYPDPVAAAVIAQLSGVDGITVHLREDRRHIQDRDVYLLKEIVKIRFNLEMALHPDIIDTALKIVPDDVCIVPEKREEITTEGGLDVIRNKQELMRVIPLLREKGIKVSLFIDPDRSQIESSKEAGADYIELHTGRYASSPEGEIRDRELSALKDCAGLAVSMGLGVNAGHGLDYSNVYDITLIKEIETLNIGHSIISRAVFTGLEKALSEMRSILRGGTPA
jgi:pyridoxine 5-phosphate synthase